MEKLLSVGQFEWLRNRILSNTAKEQVVVHVCMTGCRAYGSASVRDALVEEVALKFDDRLGDLDGSNLDRIEILRPKRCGDEQQASRSCRCVGLQEPDTPRDVGAHLAILLPGRQAPAAENQCKNA